MVDENNKSKESESNFFPPRIVHHHDQTVLAGKLVELDLSNYFEPQENETLSYDLVKAPAGLSIDSETGILTGISPPNKTNQTYILDVGATSSLTNLSSYLLINLHVIGSAMAETVDQSLFGLTPDKFEELGEEYNKLFLQYMLSQYYLCVQLQDGYYTGEGKGALLNARKTQTGWSVYEYEHCLVVTPGEVLFAEGNRGKFLTTLREVYLRDIPEKKWESIFVLGDDPDTVGRAWVLAKEMELPVTDVAPTYVAEVNLATLERVRNTFGR